MSEKNKMKLSLEQEQELVRMYKSTGIKKYSDAVVLSQNAFIHIQARKYTSNPELYKDLVQEGFVRACIALKSYSLDKGTAFRSYCKVAVMHAMGEYLARASYVFYMGADIRNFNYEAQRERAGLIDTNLPYNDESPEKIVMRDEIKHMARRLFG